MIKLTPWQASSIAGNSFCFFVIDHRKNVYLDTCREEFRWNMKGKKNKDFFVKTNDFNSKRKLIEKYESKIKIPQKLRMKVVDTNLSRVYFIKPNWWTKNLLRFEILTATLKNPKYYFNEHTKNVMSLFLNGYTNNKKSIFSDENIEESGGFVNTCDYFVPMESGLGVYK